MSETATLGDDAAAHHKRETASALGHAYARVRQRTEELTAPLSAEDQTIQSMTDASPAKWHRAHTTWFFETFLLVPHAPGYEVFDPDYNFLFNSYYEAVGERHARPRRGMITRPGIAEIAAYRAHVDAAMQAFIATCDSALCPLIELGLNHEEQHQELIVTDIKHAFAENPTFPVYASDNNAERVEKAAPKLNWFEIEGGIYRIGHEGDGFAYDNETPAHETLLQDMRIASRPVSTGEYLDFIADGGYERPEFWLSDGWATVQAEGWQAPLYWHRDGNLWMTYTLYGLQPVRECEPVTHVSYYEANAFAAWAGKRLPTEMEREVAARLHGEKDELAPQAGIHPRPLAPGFTQDVWEWTESAYLPYPGFKPAKGAVGEYNGKFMVNQMVLRGRSCATPNGHQRISYRNFFPASARWQFSGFRLAEDN